MRKKQSEKLAPATSQAKYPTLIELRQDGGILFKGFAAAVLATGLAGCGKTTETSPTPDAAALDTRSADTGSGQIMETSGTSDLGSPDRSLDRSPDWPWIVIDGVPAPPPDTQPDVSADASPDLRTPDLRTPDRISMVDGGPPIFEVHNDTWPKDAIDARDAATDRQGPDGTLDGSNDSEDDVK